MDLAAFLVSYFILLFWYLYYRKVNNFKFKDLIINLFVIYENKIKIIELLSIIDTKINYYVSPCSDNNKLVLNSLKKIKTNFSKVFNYQFIKFNNGPCYTLCLTLFFWKIKRKLIRFSMMKPQWKMRPCSSDKKMLMMIIMRIFSNSVKKTNKHSIVVLLISRWSFMVALKTI